MRVAAVIPAAGRGARLKSKSPKAFVNVLGRPLLARTLDSLLNAYPFDEVLVMVDPAHVLKARQLLKREGFKQVRVEAGGPTRAESVKRGVLALNGRASWVLVHDAARPLIDKRTVARTLKAARASGAALCVSPVIATVKKLGPSRDVVLGTEDRQRLCLAQTPQVFRRDLLLSRYRVLGQKALEATDEAALFDRSPVRVRVVEGSPRNLKVTTPEDLDLLKYYLRSF